MKESLRVTETVFGKDCREGLMEGVCTLHSPVASTLGASGRTVIIEDLYGNPKPTKDGVTVAKAIVPLDAVERMGSEIIKQASLNTANEAGDGTTTSTIIAKEIIDRGMDKLEDKSINYTEFNKGMQFAVEVLTKALDRDAVKVDLSNISSVATISANNDEVLGGIIADAFQKAGENGVVLMEKSDSNMTYVEVTDGFELEKGYKSEYFITNKEQNRVEFENAIVVISNTKVERIEQIEPFIQLSGMNGHAPVVFVCEMEEPVLATLAMNNIRGSIKCAVVEPSHFGIRRKDILRDLAVCTGGIMIDEDSGDNFDLLQIPQDQSKREMAIGRIKEYIGFADKVTIDRYKSVFFNESTQSIAEHTKALKTQLEAEENPMEKDFLKERIAKVSSAVAVVYVGASSTAEQSEKADRVDDAIHAVKAALSEGIVAGGGVALHNLSMRTLWNDSDIIEAYESIESHVIKQGFLAVLDSIMSPLITILSNGDVKYDEYMFPEKNFGVNIKTGERGNMFDMKIIDPVKVTKTALKNAVSAASTLLSTTSVIVNLRKA